MNELSVSRFIAAPPEKVWDVLANRQEEWWCPAPWKVRLDKQDKRAGGACDMTILGPDGEEMPNRGIYLEWDEGRRFVTTDAMTEGFVPAEPFMVGTWEIEPATEDGVAGTRYTASARHWSEEARRNHEEMGLVQGWEACAAQLADICERESG